MTTTRATARDPRQFILAFDAGGTMMDAILVKPDGSFTVGKSISRSRFSPNIRAPRRPRRRRRSPAAATSRRRWDAPLNVYEMAQLAAGNVVAGPATIRDPMTTIVIPPQRSITFDKYRVLHCG